MPAPKGGPSNNPNGRPKGVPNRLTTEIKTMVLDALNDLGGKDYLVQQALKDNASPFMALIGKTMPLQLEGGDPDKPIRGEFTVGIVKLADQSN